MEKEVKDMESGTDGVTVKVLVSFFLCSQGGSTSKQAMHKEKFSVPMATMNCTIV